MLTQLRMSVSSILNRIRDHHDGFRSAQSRGISGLFLGIRAKTAPSIIFDAAMLKEISLPGVDLEIDLIID